MINATSDHTGIVINSLPKIHHHFIDESTEKGQLREEDRYKWGCGLRPHPHLYPSLLLVHGFFSALID
jgi:hypothetical protein